MKIHHVHTHTDKKSSLCVFKSLSETQNENKALLIYTNILGVSQGEFYEQTDKNQVVGLEIE